MPKNIYTKTGTCIFCKKSFPEVEFKNRPHILPRSMGGDIIGFDICNQCNSYFGESDSLIPEPPRFSVEVCLKEVLNFSRYMLDKKQQEKRYGSTFFNIWMSKHLVEVNVKNWQTEKVQRLIARQFKRGLFEAFLQAYHFHTQNGLDERFDKIRDFARYNVGDCNVYFLQNCGHIFLRMKDMSHPYFAITEPLLKEIEEYGFYSLYFNGLRFFLDVLPKPDELKREFLAKAEKEVDNLFVDSLGKLEFINQIDFTLARHTHFDYKVKR